jgi:hypothetical protein
VQGEFNSPLRRFTHVEVVNGMNTPLAQSSGDWLQLEPQACSAHGATPMMPSVGVQMTQPRIPH